MRIGILQDNPHSWHTEVNAFFHDGESFTMALPEAETVRFFAEREFDGLIVSDAYKQKILSFIDRLDSTAEYAQAADCVVNRGGVLTGYNTGLYGFRDFLFVKDIPVRKRTVYLTDDGLNTTGYARVISQLGGTPVVGNDPQKIGDIAEQVQVIVHTGEQDLDLGMFPELETVIDLDVERFRTKLLSEAKHLDKKAYGGLEIFVRQIWSANCLFQGKTLDPFAAEECVREMKRRHRNIVLIGMPTSGKTTMTSILAERLHKPYVEIDDEIVKKTGHTIPELFTLYREEGFRKIESECIYEHRNDDGVIISCGGGVIKNEVNLKWLSERGLIFWMDRNLEKLFPSDTRPLSNTMDSLKEIYEERRPLYEKYADVRVDNNSTLEATAEAILEAIAE